MRFDATRDEMNLIVAIVGRYESIVGANQCHRMTAMISLEACHCNATPLDLLALCDAPRDYDLVHDVAGIIRHIDRETGKLGGCFRPRYAARAPGGPPETSPVPNSPEGVNHGRT